MQEKNTQKIRLGKAATHAIRKHRGQLAIVILFQLLLRIAALLPAILGVSGMGGESISSILFYALTMLLYVFAVMPFRFHAGQWLRYFVDDQAKKPGNGMPYFSWLKKGIIRLLRGLPFGIPVFAIMGYLVIGSRVLPYNQMWQPVQNLALIFGMEPTLLHGMIAGLPLVLLLVLFFCLGWLRDLPAEYALLGDRVWNKVARKKAKGMLISNFIVNSLLFLPALLGICLVIIPYILQNVDFSGSVLLTIRDMTELMDRPLPGKLLMLLAGDFVVLYLPLCALRKIRNAVLTEKMLGGKHAAG